MTAQREASITCPECARRGGWHTPDCETGRTKIAQWRAVGKRVTDKDAEIDQKPPKKTVLDTLGDP